MNSELISAVTMPGNEEAEKAILGTVLSSPGMLLVAANHLRTSECFASEKHRLIWNTILEMHAQSWPIDLVTTTTELRRKRILEKIGGLSYLAELSGKSGNAYHFERWCLILMESYLKRLTLNTGINLQKKALDPSVDAFELLSYAQGAITNAADGIRLTNAVKLIDTCKEVLKDIDTALNNPEGVYVPWHLAGLDGLLGGMRSPSADFWILAGLAGCGKTAMLIWIALQNAVRNVSVGFVSLEMPAKDLVTRMAVSQMSGRYTNGEIRKGYDHNGEVIDIIAVQNAMSMFAEAPLHICDQGGLDIQQLILIALDWKRKYKIRLLLVDYLQLLQDQTVSGSNDTARISSISRKLKALSKILDVPIIAISNLTKEAVKSHDGRPHKSHLRESGQIEFDADGIIILYRPEYHGVKSLNDPTYPMVKDTTGLIQAQIEKNRNGPCDTVNLWADVRTNRFFVQQPNEPF